MSARQFLSAFGSFKMCIIQSKVPMGNRCVWTYTLLTVAVSLIRSWKLSSVKLQNASWKTNLLIVLVNSFSFFFSGYNGRNQIIYHRTLQAINTEITFALVHCRVFTSNMWLFSYSLVLYKDTVEAGCYSCLHVTAGAGEISIPPYRDSLPVSEGEKEGKARKSVCF